jgi:hypothetical protein
MVSLEESDEEEEEDFGGRLPAGAELIIMPAAAASMSNLRGLDSTSFPTGRPTDPIIFVPPILC